MKGQTPASKQIASILLLERGDVASSRKYAQEMSEMDPRALSLVRNHYLRVRDFSGVRARYAKVFPELFENELPPIGRSADAAIDLALVLQHPVSKSGR